MLDDLSQLKQLVDDLSILSQQDWNAFAAIWRPFLAKRKQLLTLTGEREKYLYFVLEGVQRVYYSDEQNREATLVFTYAPSFGGVLDALLLQQPSRYFYETLSPSRFLRAAFGDLQALMQTRPAIEALVREGVTRSLAGVMKRLVELQCYSSEEKFRQLLHRSPHILQRVPHKYLANYLGIDPTNFSKLVNKVKI